MIIFVLKSIKNTHFSFNRIYMPILFHHNTSYFLYSPIRFMFTLIILRTEIHIKYICPYATLNIMNPEENKISAIKSIIAANSSISIDPLISTIPLLATLFLLIKRFQCTRIVHHYQMLTNDLHFLKQNADYKKAFHNLRALPHLFHPYNF